MGFNSTGVRGRLEWTRHAAIRCAERGISGVAVHAAWVWGSRTRRHNRRITCVVDRYAVARARAAGAAIDAFFGTAIVVSLDLRFLTAWLEGRGGRA